MSELWLAYMGRYFEVSMDWYEALMACYPDISVWNELCMMDAWLDANPRRRKKNYRRFITNWLKAEQRKAVVARSEVMVGAGPQCLNPVRKKA